MKLSHAVLASTLLLAGGQAMACYVVYDKNNQVVYSSQEAPVDMTRPLHETVPAKFPGGHLVFNKGADCPSEARLRVVSTNGKSPLLTDSRTAESMGLPHTDLGNGVVMVPERPDSMRSGVMLLESGLPRDDTRAMGAPPAQQQTAGRAARPAQPQFITPNGAPPSGVSRSTR